MGVDGSIACCSGQVLSLSVRNVFSVPLDVALGKSEIKDENFVGGFVESDAEVIGFDVSVDEVSVVDVFNSGDHLVHEYEDGLE
jgi:hypothetical protein